MLLIEFDQDMRSKTIALKGKGRGVAGGQGIEDEDEGEMDEGVSKYGTAVTLLIDHTHSIPVRLRLLLDSFVTMEHQLISTIYVNRYRR